MARFRRRSETGGTGGPETSDDGPVIIERTDEPSTPTESPSNDPYVGGRRVGCSTTVLALLLVNVAVTGSIAL